ncbi:MAG TPA: zf-HC2 domain-containing protein [bacterium]|nr:zf-HC2 domain-containing protein [bacterium]
MTQKHHRDGRPDTIHPCPYDLNDMLDYIHGTLEPGHCKRFEAHLEDCPACRNTVSSLARITPETTRNFMNETPDDAAVLGGEPAVPFPSVLALRIRLEHVRRECRRLVSLSRENLARLARDMMIEPPAQPVYSGVRHHDAGMIQMDIVNLTENNLDETRLKPVIEEDQWALAGFPAAFLNSEAWLLLIPVADLRTLIPGWNRHDGQAQLTEYLKNGPDPAMMPGVAALEGVFETTGGEIRLTVDVVPDCKRLMEQVDAMAAAIIIV